MSERATHRAEILNKLGSALSQDPRLLGAVLVGSGAYGFRDDESDIDLVAPVASEYDAAVVFHEWKDRVEQVVAVRYRAETAFTEQNHLLVLICDGMLEIDLSFPPIASLTALTPHRRVLWERSPEVTERVSVPPADTLHEPEHAYAQLVNRVVHRALYAAKAVRRGQVWKAVLLLDQLRFRTLQLACLDTLGVLYSDALGDDGVERHADELPAALLAQYTQTLPPDAGIDDVQRSLAACVELALGHIAALDPRYGMNLHAVLQPLLGIQLPGRQALADVLEVERQWTDAHLHGDFATIANLMADDYIRILPDGSVADKATVLAAYRPETRAWEHAAGDQYDVRMYGNTALVIGRWTARGINNGQAFDYAARFMSVYVLRDGRWRMVAEQSTDIG